MFQGGRIESIACPSGINTTIYVGVGSGNIWKTNNNGTTWKPIFENESTFTIGDIDVSNSNPNVVWVGTGENLMARSSFAGTGVFKSIDAGKTWQNMGLHNTHHIGRIVIDPLDPDIVYVAALGHNYSFNEERGLFKTTDGGKTWNKVLYLSERVGVVYYEQQFGSLKRKNLKDGTTKYIQPRAKKGEPPLRYNWMTPFIISHHNPFTLYYGANRIFKSINKGDNWAYISPDLTANPGPEKQGNVPYGTITSISESSLKIGLIYVGTDDGNVFVTRDDGVSWTEINTGLPRKWVSRVVASCYDEGTVYVSLTGYREDDFKRYLYMSTDFGKT